MNEKTKRIDIVTIQMIKEASIRYQYRKITSPSEMQPLISSFIGDKDREHFGVVCLDVKNQPQNIMIVSIGTLNSSMIHPREVFKTAILSNSASIIIFHNHPSGVLSPSDADIEVTKRLKEAGKVLGIELLDHIIVEGESFLSMKEKLMI